MAALRSCTCSLVALLAGSLLVVSAADWPQWMGPQRNGASPETGLLTTFPAGGPKVLWKVEGGEGMSGIAVAGGRAFTLVQRGKDELVLALDAATGKELWKKRTGPAWVEEQGDGPRSTPTVDGNFVYVQSATGPLLCLEAASGKVLWEHDILKEFSAKNISWAMSASPLIEGDLVLVIPGAKGAGVAAFHKTTGKVAWKTGDDKAAYASPVAVTLDGKRQAIFFTATGLLAVEAKSGKELWRVPWHTGYDCNIATPLVIGDRLFVSSGEKVGCALFTLSSDKPSVAWESKGNRSVMINYWATAVAHDKHLYGVAGEYNSPMSLKCVDLASGKEQWNKERFGKASVTLADGQLWITTDAGDLVLVAASPKSYEEKARAKLMTPYKYATMPTIADKKIYLRDQQNILCVDIAGK